MNGQIDFDDFDVQAKLFHSLSVKLGDTWQLEKYQRGAGMAGLYLKKYCTISVSDLSSKNYSNSSSDEIYCGDNEELDYGLEDCDLSAISNSSDTLIQVEYHVVYSDSYSVPVLYFNAHHLSGQSLQHNELEVLFSPSHASTMKQQIWTTLTQVEHPILQTPYYMLHPCKTASLMASVMPADRNINLKHDNYLIQWMSTICPAVRLTIDIDYLKLVAAE